MSKFKVFLLCVVVFVIGSFFVIMKASSQGESPTFSLVSPLPKILSSVFDNYTKSVYWKPEVERATAASIEPPELTALSALSYDLTTNKLLYAKDIKERRPLASLTKIMTAVVALENEKLEKEITITDAAASIGEDSMGLSGGEKLTLHDLMYGMMLHSGNDAAEAIAEGSKFGKENYVYVMNKKAEELGLIDTHFTNPTGLEGDGNQYSTAYDLLVMTRYGLAKPFFKEVVGTVNYEIPSSPTHKAYHLFNETNLLTSYPGVKGVKTGFTYEAGLCLVTYLEYDGHHIIGILLNSQNRRQEMKDLLDYSLKSLGIKPPEHG